MEKRYSHRPWVAWAWALVLHGAVLSQKIHVSRPSPQATAPMAKKVSVKLVKQIVNNTQTPSQEVSPKAHFLGKSDQSFAKQTKARRVGRFQEGGGPKRPPKLSLADLGFSPFQASPQRHVAQNNDYLEDVEEGEITRLNTQKWKYYGFYQRVRAQLEQYWENILRKKVRALSLRGRFIASVNMTSLKVTLDAQGNIISIVVLTSSGIQEFDDAAIESFNKAGPFPNPPKGMMGPGKAVALTWGFIAQG